MKIKINGIEIDNVLTDNLDLQFQKSSSDVKNTMFNFLDKEKKDYKETIELLVGLSIASLMYVLLDDILLDLMEIINFGDIDLENIDNGIIDDRPAYLYL